MSKEDIVKFIDSDVFYRCDYAYFLYKQLEIKDLILKALHKYFNEHEQYEDNEFLRQLESVIDNENDINWLRKMAGDTNVKV